MVVTRMMGTVYVRKDTDWIKIGFVKVKFYYLSFTSKKKKKEIVFMIYNYIPIERNNGSVTVIGGFSDINQGR
jgi:hypothetical protein